VCGALEYQVRQRDGGTIWISENSRTVRDTNGKIRYYEGFIEEITKRKEAEVFVAAIPSSGSWKLRVWSGWRNRQDGVLHNIATRSTALTCPPASHAGKVADSTGRRLIQGNGNVA